MLYEISNNSSLDVYGQILIYTTADGKANLDVQVDANTVWLTQQIAQLYGKAVSTINEHLKNIFEEEELDPQVVIRNFRITTQHGAIQGKTQTNDVMCYNLDAILAEMIEKEFALPYFEFVYDDK